MHEMSIALSILDIVTENAINSNAKSVTEVELEIGELSGIEIDALMFAFDTAKYGTLLENCETKIIRVQPLAKCASCGHEYDIGNLWATCPNCSDTKLDIVAGKEIRVKSINIV